MQGGLNRDPTNERLLALAWDRKDFKEDEDLGIDFEGESKWEWQWERIRNIHHSVEKFATLYTWGWGHPPDKAERKNEQDCRVSQQATWPTCAAPRMSKDGQKTNTSLAWSGYEGNGVDLATGCQTCWKIMKTEKSRYFPFHGNPRTGREIGMLVFQKSSFTGKSQT